MNDNRPWTLPLVLPALPPVTRANIIKGLIVSAVAVPAVFVLLLWIA